MVVWVVVGSKKILMKEPKKSHKILREFAHAVVYFEFTVVNKK